MRVEAAPPKTVGDLMTTDLIALIPTDVLGRARHLLAMEGFHALPVMDGNDVLGIVTTADLARGDADDVAVTDVMTPTPTEISVEAAIADAAQLMVSSRIHHLLASDDREVVGIVSSLDLLQAFPPPSGDE